jgi:hypothetical protein
MRKTVLMLTGLAGVFAVGTACSGMFSKADDPAPPAAGQACAGLTGQARTDCEQRQAQ